MARTKKTTENYNLVIVESPAKAKTIEKFLGKGYKVAASNGHLIDLPKSKMGIDIEGNFEPQYIVIRGRTALLNDLKKQAKEANQVYLATDPDREGEAISWHIANVLPKEKQDIHRVEFNEITKKAVVNAIANPREIDVDRVNAQQARRVMDRLVGYKLSPLLWTKVRRGLSAGRVQSSTVKLIVDREREIRDFKPQEYWTISAILTDRNKKHAFEADFYGQNKKKLVPESEQEVQKILQTIDGKDFIITDVKKSMRQRKAYAPFTTSTLQQDAARKLGFTTKRTMMVAQGLYEGVKVTDTETVGLITYMRTDSTRISDEARDAAKAYILEKYGAEYYPGKPNVYAGRKNAQDAHEAIRPTYVQYTPDSIRDRLTPEQYRLYNLIYTRFIASQMTPAQYDTMSYELDAEGYTFRANFSKMKFPGYLAIYKEETPDNQELVNLSMPPMGEGDACIAKEINPKQNFTTPPPRFTEASLVRTLEELGIGRPSTYAPTISTILDRQYVKKDKRVILPTDLGEVVTELMEKSFPDIVDAEFTADMEEKLDKVEEGTQNWVELLRDFYNPFAETLEKADAAIGKVSLQDEVSDVPCDKCGRMMVYKMGRFGKFLACPGFPECRNAKPIVNDIGIPCPKCGGKILERRSKKGRIFYACEAEKCDVILWDKPTGKLCDVCGSPMVSRKRGKTTIAACSNRECGGAKEK